MAKTFSQKMKELRRVAKLHANWLIYATLGESAVTKEELEELTKYGKLPMGSSLDLVDKSYLLGRLKAILKSSEYKKVSYEEASEKAEGMKLSPLEELVIEQARLKAGTYLKNLSTEINNGVYDALSQSIGKAVSEASVSDAVADEVALAAIYKKTAQQLASDLASRLQTEAKKNWTAVAKTELQRAKIAGHAQAIVNKLDIYQNSDGANSEVSIIPAKECCTDCREHYLDAKGNPKVFKLADLMSAGSNADDGVSHSKRNGKHVHWKTTLPPLHPNCGCQLFYIPPGYGWSSGKLELLNKSLFEESILRKARSGVRSAEMSAIITPKGPPKPPEPPGGMSGGGTGGRPPAGGGLAAPAGAGGGGMDEAPCPFGGGEECSKHGGDGAQQHKIGGEVFQDHQAAMARIAKVLKPQSEQQKEQQTEEQSKQYDSQPHPTAITAKHLETGKISFAKLLGEEEGGLHSSYQVQIEGNGRGCMKPPPIYSESIYAGNGCADGAASTPKNKGHLSERAAYATAVSLGLNEHVPVTVIRDHDGSSGVPYEGEMSVQHWQEDFVSRTRLNRKDIKKYTDFIKAVPEEHRENVEKKLQEIACLHFIANNTDGSDENIVVKKDLSDVRAIDHGLAFGAGMDSHKNGIHRWLSQSGKTLTVPDHLLTRCKAQSFAETKRALDNQGLKYWQVAHEHLRRKYLAHLQENYGQVPVEATRYANTRAMSADPNEREKFSSVSRYAIPAGPGWEGTDFSDRVHEADAAYGRWEMPDQLFARFAKEYISGGLNSDLTEEDRSELMNAMVLFPAGTGYRDGGTLQERKEYWNSIPTWKAPRSWTESGEGYTEPARTPAPVSELTPGTAGETPASRRRKMRAAQETSEVDPFARTVYVPSNETTQKSLYISDFSMAFPLDSLNWE